MIKSSVRFVRKDAMLSFQRGVVSSFQGKGRLHCKAEMPRTFASTVNRTAAPAVTLYQYHICPFCNKVKALLNYTKTKFNVIEVNPLTKAEIIWSKQYRKVPIATIDEKPYFGSDEIIQAFIAGNSERIPMDMAEFDGPVAKQWQDVSTNDLAPLLYPNMCGTWKDALNAFGYIHQQPQFSRLQKASIQLVGSLAMYMAAGRVKTKRGIKDEREALETVLLRIESEGLSNGSKAFLSGSEGPHLGDLAVYGTLRAIDGLRAHDKVITERGGPLADWYSRMKIKVD